MIASTACQVAVGAFTLAGVVLGFAVAHLLRRFH